MAKLHNIKPLLDLRKKLRKKATIHEIIVWSRIRRSQLKYKFRRQRSIGKYIVDFYRPKKKLIIEIDGSQHREKQRMYGIKRDKYLNSLGFTVLRFWNNDVNNNLEGVLLKMKKYLNK